MCRPGSDPAAAQTTWWVHRCTTWPITSADYSICRVCLGATKGPEWLASSCTMCTSPCCWLCLFGCLDLWAAFCRSTAAGSKGTSPSFIPFCIKFMSSQFCTWRLRWYYSGCTSTQVRYRDGFRCSSASSSRYTSSGTTSMFTMTWSVTHRRW